MRSELAIIDLTTGTAQSVLHTERLIEAPNWTPDGKTLIVNGDGRLNRVSLEGDARLAEIDTGFAATSTMTMAFARWPPPCHQRPD